MRTVLAALTILLCTQMCTSSAYALAYAQPGITVAYDGKSYTTNGSELFKTARSANMRLEYFFSPSGVEAIRVRFDDTSPWVGAGVLDIRPWELKNVLDPYDVARRDRCALTTASGRLWKVRNASVGCTTAKRIVTRYLRGYSHTGWRCRRTTARARCVRSDDVSTAIPTTTEEMRLQDTHRGHEVEVCGHVGFGGTYGTGTVDLMVRPSGSCAESAWPALFISANIWFYDGAYPSVYDGWTFIDAGDVLIQKRYSDQSCAIIGRPLTDDPSRFYWRWDLDEQGWFTYSPYSSACP